jgi:hypothetical protein
MAINTNSQIVLVGEKMPHPKLVSLILMFTVFASVGATSWALMNSHANPEVPRQELACDAAMAYIKNSHPETRQFMKSLAWAGGRTTPENLLGAETYTYQSQGWNVTIQNAVVANPIYSITADYSAQVSPEEFGISYRILWEGTWKNGCIIETSYCFAQ